MCPLHIFRRCSHRNVNRLEGICWHGLFGKVRVLVTKTRGETPEMKEKKATVMDKVRPDLLVLPHIVGMLIHLVVGEWQPEPSQLEQLIAHLAECLYCRTALIVLLSAEQEYEKLNDYPEVPARNLLARFVTIHHEIEAQEYELMGAYAEAIVAEGKKKADKRFPILAEHIRRCPSCKSTLEETLAFLKEP